MKEVVRKISLDFSRKSNTRVVFASQSDMNTRVFLISLFDDGAPYFVTKDTIASINVCRADELSAAFTCEVTDDGCVKYTAGAWTLGIAGEAQLSIALRDGQGRRLTSSAFTVDVAPGLYLGSDIDNSDEVQSTYEDVMNLISTFNANESERITAERTRRNEEEARITNESRRYLEESWRIERESIRVSNEEARVENENIRIANEEKRCQITDAIATAIDNLLAIQADYL